ncbi:MAG: aldo/keto reductase [bacterium]|nr:aldo/keto reductase [bacterium]
MEYRKLGQTDLKVSAISLGTEHLWCKKLDLMNSVISHSIDNGINYFDVVFSFPEYLRNLGTCFKGKRDKVYLTGHLRSGTHGEREHKYRLTTNVKESEKYFNRVLKELQTEYVDVAFIQMVNALDDYHKVIEPGGVLDLALRLKKEGKLRYIGMSMHKPAAALEAVKSGKIDVLMYPINIAWDLQPGRKEVCSACFKEKVGLVAMKGFAGGRLFLKQAVVRFTPTQCLSYILSQKGVTNVVIGPSDVEQLKESLHYNEASKKEKEYKYLISKLNEEYSGICIYCSHCQPCPANIDIASVFRNYDLKMMKKSPEYKKALKKTDEKVRFIKPAWIREKPAAVKKMKGKPQECLECGVCMERCPFDVDIISKMKQVAKSK